MRDALLEQLSPAVNGHNEHAAWVVDLASRRVIRVQTVLGGVPVEAGTIPSRQELQASPDLAPVARVRTARQTLPGGDARPSLGVQHQHQHRGRSQSVSKPEENAVPFDTGRIEARAYAIYCARGCIDGLDVDDWLEAERQLRVEAGIEDATPEEAEPAQVGESGSD